MIGAQQYYIDYGGEMNMDRMSSLLTSYIPDSSLQAMRSLNYWLQGNAKVVGLLFECKSKNHSSSSYNS